MIPVNSVIFVNDMFKQRRCCHQLLPDLLALNPFYADTVLFCKPVQFLQCRYQCNPDKKSGKLHQVYMTFPPSLLPLVKSVSKLKCSLLQTKIPLVFKIFIKFQSILEHKENNTCFNFFVFATDELVFLFKLLTVRFRNHLG